MRQLTYAQALPHLKTGDLLQYRGTGLIGGMISIAGRSRYSHTAMAIQLNGSFYCAEVREFHGGRITNLKGQIAKYPGRIDVYRPARKLEVPLPDGTYKVVRFDAEKASEIMRSFANPAEYGYWKVLKASCYHLPLIRIFIGLLGKFDGIDKIDGPPFCAEAYSHAIRESFVDPVPNLADRLTEPGDLTRSPLLANFLFTLVKDD